MVPRNFSKIFLARISHGVKGFLQPLLIAYHLVINYISHSWLYPCWQLTSWGFVSSHTMSWLWISLSCSSHTPVCELNSSMQPEEQHVPRGWHSQEQSMASKCPVQDSTAEYELLWIWTENMNFCCSYSRKEKAQGSFLKCWPYTPEDGRKNPPWSRPCASAQGDAQRHFLRFWAKPQ